MPWWEHNTSKLSKLEKPVGLTLYTSFCNNNELRTCIMGSNNLIISLKSYLRINNLCVNKKTHHSLFFRINRASQEGYVPVIEP